MGGDRHTIDDIDYSADISAGESAAGNMKLIVGLNLAMSGKIFYWDASEHDW